MKNLNLALAIGALLLAGGIYFGIGTPGMADQPMSERAAELARKAPEDMTVSEWLARAEALSVEHPEDPEPHFMIGAALSRQGRDDDALRAYQSALRRDPGYVPALVAMGDAVMRLSQGEITRDAASLYAEAHRIDPTQVRAGFLVGVSAWQDGDQAQARAIWQDMAQAIPEGTREREGFDALVSTYVEAQNDMDARGEGAQ